MPGIAINALDLSPNFAGILMGVSSTISSITGILVPYIVGIATPNVSTFKPFSSTRSFQFQYGKLNCVKTCAVQFITFFFSYFGVVVYFFVLFLLLQSLLSEWRIVFWITLVLQMAKMFIFSIWGSGNVQPWNSYDDETEQNQFYNDSDVSECEYADDGSLDDCEFNRRYSI